MDEYPLYRHGSFAKPEQIRILVLEPAPDLDAPLSGILVEEGLDDIEPYEALSYCWEAPEMVGYILCEGQSLPLTSNCTSALRYLRKETEARRLWIDQICINQFDIEERNEQVRLMGEVYKKAQDVLIWLGEETPNTEKAVVFLSQIVQSLQLTEQWRRWAINSRLDDAAKENNGRRSREWWDIKYLDDILYRSWFSRVWTIQEFALSKDSTVVIGKIRFKSGMLWYALRAISINRMEAGLLSNTSGIAYRQTVLPMHLNSLLRMPPEKRSTLGQEPNSLLSTLAAIRRRDSTNPSDKIFALYGVWKELGVEMPKPNYTNSTSQIYTEATQTAILQDESLEYLYQVTGFSVQENLPSWVPDWSDPYIPHEIISQQFNATKSSPPIYHFPAERKLAIFGRPIDRLQTVSPLMPYYGLQPNKGDTVERTEQAQLEKQFRLIVHCFQAWRRMALDLASYPTGEPLETAFRRTLTRYGSSEGGRYGGDQISVLPGPLRDPIRRAQRASGREREAVSVVEISDGLQPRAVKLVDDDFARMYQAWRSIITVNDPVVGKGIGSLETLLADRLKDPEVSRFYHRSEMDEWKIVVAINHTPDAARFQHHAWTNAQHNTIFVTEKGYLGQAAHSIQAGDEVVLASGLSLPMILRRENDEWKAICPAYVHGVMDGEAWHDDDEENLEEFILA